ncbi:UDP-GlcNAc:undecaprenyl-phosphate/decaprenyl-phosphate GlcNAc-1-phosphate transferase [Gammaproteobacteria bacterium]
MFFAFVATIILSGIHFPGMMGLLCSTSLLVGLGILDDFHELSAWPRFVGQIMAAVAMYFVGGISIENLGALFGEGDVVLGPVALPFTVFATVGVINAFNMIDGIDGLAGGLSLISILFFSFLAGLGDHHTDLVMLMLLGAAIVAFLLFNLRFPGRPFALVFMGDAGSMFLGFMLCWFAVGLSQGEHRAMAPVTALWILAVPLFDTLSVMIRRLTNGKSPFIADRGHLHHMLMERLPTKRPQLDQQQTIQHNISSTIIIIFTLAVVLGLIGVTLDILGVSEVASLLLFLAIFGVYLRLTIHAERLRVLMTRRWLSRRSPTEKHAKLRLPSVTTFPPRFTVRLPQSPGQE